VPGITRARDALIAMIGAEVHTFPTCGKPVLLGFSQGAMLTYAITAREPQLIGAAFPLAGTLPNALGPFGRVSPDGLPTVVGFHGDADSRIALADDRATDARFRAAGFPGELRVFPNVGHMIPADMRAELLARIEPVLRAQDCASPPGH
jgi:phospholipase/carboxylesterase